MFTRLSFRFSDIAIASALFLLVGIGIGCSLNAVSNHDLRPAQPSLHGHIAPCLRERVMRAGLNTDVTVLPELLEHHRSGKPFCGSG